MSMAQTKKSCRQPTIADAHAVCHFVEDALDLHFDVHSIT